MPQNRCCPAGGCSTTTGAQSAGPRSLETAHKLAAAGADVVAGSICDPSFGTILDDIAEIVKPPSGLTLPTLPAADEVTMLRIASGDGQTRKVCDGPLAPSAGWSLQNAQDAVNPATGRRWDWWFTEDGNPRPPAMNVDGSLKVTKFVYINPLGGCIANPGETYSADYLGQVPAGGCWNNTSYAPLPYTDARGASHVERNGDAMCRSILGGAAGSWTCYAGVDSTQACVAPTQSAPGTCICGSPAQNGCTP
jgi:hypothetical protein